MALDTKSISASLQFGVGGLIMFVIGLALMIYGQTRESLDGVGQATLGFLLLAFGFILAAASFLIWGLGRMRSEVPKHERKA